MHSLCETFLRRETTEKQIFDRFLDVNYVSSDMKCSSSSSNTNILQMDLNRPRPYTVQAKMNDSRAIA